MTPLVAIVCALAVYRCTLLAVADAVTEPPRSAVIAWVYRRSGRRLQLRQGETWDEATRRDDKPPKLAVLAVCPWCASPYIAVPAVWLTLAFADGWVWWLVAGSLAASGVTGLLAEHASPAS